MLCYSNHKWNCHLSNVYCMCFVHVGQVKKKKITELQKHVDFLLKLHEEVDEAFLEVSVDFQKMCMLLHTTVLIIV